MKPPPFEYLVPESLEAALSFLEANGDEAKLLAGGQSLVPAMNFRIVQPAVLIDLNRIRELDFIEQTDGGGLSIGAMVRQRTLESDPQVASLAPLLQDTVPHIAHPQIRNRGTLGGSLAHADPAAELPVVALTLDARFRLQSSKGSRWVPSQEFFQGMFTTSLAADEILTEVEIPPMLPRTGWSFQEFSRRHGDYAIMGVAALVVLDSRGQCESARLLYLNAGDGPVDAQQAAALLINSGNQLEAISEACALAAEKEIDPFGNVHASVEYQRHLARILTRRALEQAFVRARQGDQ